jgi:hypothetical protein
MPPNIVTLMRILQSIAQRGICPSALLAARSKWRVLETLRKWAGSGDVAANEKAAARPAGCG